MQQTPTPPSAPAIATNAPQTRADLDALSMLRSELRDQRSALMKERAELIVQQRLGASSEQTAAKLAALDARTARIDQQIASADEAIASGIARGIVTGGGARTVVSVPPVFPGFLRGPDTSKMIGSLIGANVATMAILAVLFLTIARRQLRGRPSADVVASQERRLDQLQAAVDTMAVEVERISEGQRYVTKLLSDRLPASTDRKS